jgi:peptidoglycan LD-endopeptidase CwlK
MIDSRDINDLKPYVKHLAQKLIDECKKQNIPIKITSTLRDNEYQNKLYAQGRTAPGIIVTSVRGGDSYHNWGLAFDVCINIVGKEWDLPLLEKVGQIGPKLGLEWGGNWKGFIDRPHFQWTGGLSTAELKAGKTPSYPQIPQPSLIPAYKAIIQTKCKFSNPQEVWDLFDKHKYPEALYKKFADSYR